MWQVLKCHVKGKAIVIGRVTAQGKGNYKMKQIIKQNVLTLVYPRQAAI